MTEVIPPAGRQPVTARNGNDSDPDRWVRYYGTRYYSPSQGRFINRDTIAEQGGLNLYSIVSNNLTNHIDILGHVEDETTDNTTMWGRLNYYFGVNHTPYDAGTTITGPQAARTVAGAANDLAGYVAPAGRTIGMGVGIVAVIVGGPEELFGAGVIGAGYGVYRATGSLIDTYNLASAGLLFQSGDYAGARQVIASSQGPFGTLSTQVFGAGQVTAAAELFDATISLTPNTNEVANINWSTFGANDIGTVLNFFNAAKDEAKAAINAGKGGAPSGVPSAGAGGGSQGSSGGQNANGSNKYSAKTMADFRNSRFGGSDPATWEADAKTANRVAIDGKNQ